MRLKALLYYALIGLVQATGFAGGLDITGKYPSDFLDIIQEVSCAGDKIII